MQYETTDDWCKAARVGQSIGGVISIPVTSAVCAKAVTVFCQSVLDANIPLLSLRQMLVLADKGWTDLATLLNMVRPSTSRRMGSPLLILSRWSCGNWYVIWIHSLSPTNFRIAIGFVIPIIQTSRVGNEHVSLLTTQDSRNLTFLGYQVNAQILAALSRDSVMDKIISSTVTRSLNDKRPFLWSPAQDSSATFGPTTVFATTAASSSSASIYSAPQLCAQLRFPSNSLTSMKLIGLPCSAAEPNQLDSRQSTSDLSPWIDASVPPLLGPLMTPTLAIKTKFPAALTLATYAAGNTIFEH